MARWTTSFWNIKSPVSTRLLRQMLLCMLPFVVCVAKAQQTASWQEIWHEVMSGEETETSDWEESFDWLEQLAAQPLDINQATRTELEQLPFLSSRQVMDLMEYLERYGPMRSLGELRMVSSLDYAQLQLLPFFVYVGTSGEKKDSSPTLDSLLRWGRHELTGSLRIPFYTRRGDENGYLGYRYRHELRYEFRSANRLRAGILGAQDAGEPFGANKNRWGYDAYSYYVQLKGMGVVENAVVGKYKMSAGMGLVMGSSFMLGKLAAMQTMGRTPALLRPHASRSEADYLQGAAATLRLAPSWRLTPYLSCRAMDATLNADSTARTLITSGYHRTPTEMEKKYNVRATDLGVSLGWQHGPLHAGFHAAYTHLDRSLQPDTSSLFRRYQASGSDFMNLSASYGYSSWRLRLSGETAIDRKGHLATFHVLNYQPSNALALMAIQRFYSYRYQSLHAHALSEGGHVQNESGLMLGATWKPLRRWHLQVYADYAYFPWARSMTSQASSAVDLLASSVIELGSWTFKARYRCHRRERDDETKSTLEHHTEHRARLSTTYSSKGVPLSLTTQGDYLQATGQGWMVSESASWQPRRWLLSMTAAYFNAGSGASLYLYERQLPHSFDFGSLTGEGLRCSLLARYEVGRWLCHVRLGYTHYFDRASIASGLQQIAHSSKTDLDVQLRYRIGR